MSSGGFSGGVDLTAVLSVGAAASAFAFIARSLMNSKVAVAVERGMSWSEDSSIS